MDLLERLRFESSERAKDPEWFDEDFSKAVVEAADTIERQRTLISDMMTVMMNRLDTQESKVKAILLRAIEEMPESDFIPE